MDNSNDALDSYEAWPVTMKLDEITHRLEKLHAEPQSTVEYSLRGAVLALTDIVRDIATKADEQGFVRGYRAAHQDLGMPPSMASAMTPTPDRSTNAATSQDSVPPSALKRASENIG